MNFSCCLYQLVKGSLPVWEDVGSKGAGGEPLKGHDIKPLSMCNYTKKNVEKQDFTRLFIYQLMELFE
jgi:hypothetical protein